jgi:hypothetical protein
MPRFTKLETEALDIVVNEVLAGDPAEFFNGGRQVSDPPKTPDEKRAVKLYKALVSAQSKF